MWVTRHHYSSVVVVVVECRGFAGEDISYESNKTLSLIDQIGIVFVSSIDLRRRSSPLSIDSTANMLYYYRPTRMQLLILQLLEMV